MAATQIPIEDVNLGLPIPRGSRLRSVKRIVAKLIWPFLSHQVKINNAILADTTKLSQNDEELSRTLNGITDALGQIQFSLAHHSSVLERFEQTLTKHDGFIHYNEQVLRQHLEALERQDQVLERHEQALERHDKTIVGQESVLIHHDEVCTRQDITLEQHEKYISQVTEISDSMGRLSTLIELVQQQSFTRLYDTLGPIQQELNDYGRRLRDCENSNIENSAVLQSLADTSQTLEEMNEFKHTVKDEMNEFKHTVKDEISNTKYSLETQVKSVWPRLAQVDLFLNEVKRSLPEKPSREVLAKLPSSFEGLYSALEDTFRGSEENIKSLLGGYLPLLNQIKSLGPVLDIGCGRGEFLELLKDNKINAYGVDMLQANIDKCTKKNLKAELADAFYHLESIPSGSLGAITAIHIIEHFDTEHQIELIDRAFAALAPNGLLIIETPNPENILTGSCNFYLDPTHLKPLPPMLLEFLVNARGFGDVKIMRHDRDNYIYGINSILQDDNADPNLRLLTEELSKLLISGPDYAIIGKKIA